MIAVEVPYGSCRRTVCPVYCSFGRIQTLLVDIHLVIVYLAQWAINRAKCPSAGTVRALYGYCMALQGYRTAPPQLPVRHVHGYRGLVFERR